jgi:[pyruvate, water dikinase]-phosphate phosphotransferase / [pyruvate, water dikinase] kinase
MDPCRCKRKCDCCSSSSERIGLRVGKKVSVNIGHLRIFALSDSSGDTAEAVIRAALAQFPRGAAGVERLPLIRSCQQIVNLIAEIAADQPVIAYTLVVPELRKAMEEEAARHNISTIDLLGPLISRVSELTGRQPLWQPGRMHELSDSYFPRVAALKFAIKFDDGQSPDGLALADVVLVGISRTGKTPNCMYLAQHYGLKAANVPIVPGLDLPAKLFEVSPKKIIGLTLDADILQDIRSVRAQEFGIPAGADYIDPENIRNEIRYAKRVFSDLKCHSIDVTAKAIEETSSEIFYHLRLEAESGSENK